MAASFDYTAPAWRALAAEARARDGARCSLGRFLGGECSDTLHAHHLIPVAEDPRQAWDLNNVLTVCSRHHPQVEAVRRAVLHQRGLRPCRHRHPYPQGREECLRRRLAEIGA